MAFRTVLLLGFSFEDKKQPKTTTSCQTLFNLFKCLTCLNQVSLHKTKRSSLPCSYQRGGKAVTWEEERGTVHIRLQEQNQEENEALNPIWSQTGGNDAFLQTLLHFVTAEKEHPSFFSLLCLRFKIAEYVVLYQPTIFKRNLF